MSRLMVFIRDEEAQDLVEYALLLGFVVLVGYAVGSSLGTPIVTKLSQLSGKLT